MYVETRVRFVEIMVQHVVSWNTLNINVVYSQDSLIHAFHDTFNIRV